MGSDFIPDDQFQPDDENRTPASAPNPEPQPSPDPTPSPAPSQNQPAPDFVPDAQFTPDDDMSGSPDFVPDNQFQPDDEKYGSGTQQAIGYAEAVGRGLAGPLAPLAEEKIFGVSPQAIAGRASDLGAAGEVTEAATFAGSMLLGTGEASLISKAGEAFAKAADCGKLASSFIKNVAEMGLFIGSNKAEKAAMGTLDPHETTSSALAQDGALALLGGAGGTAIESIASPVLQKIGDSEIGSKASQFLSNFGSRLKFWQTGGGDMAGALADQMEGVHSNVAAARESAFGPTGVKARNIQLLTQEDGITQDQVTQHVGSVLGAISDLPDEILNDPKALRAINNFKNSIYLNPGEVAAPTAVSPDISEINPEEFTPRSIYGTPEPTDAQLARMGQIGSATDAQNIAAANAAGFNPYESGPVMASPDKVFLATDQLKRDMGELAKFGKQRGSTSTADVVADQAQDLYGTLKNSLENQDIWGRSAELQQGLNAAFTKFKPNNDNFLSKFTEKDFTDPSRVVSPGRVNTYVNQLGKPQAEIKQGMVGGWINSYEDYANEVNALHARLGLETQLAPVPTDLIKQSAQQTDAGGELADQFYNFQINGLASRVAQSAVLGGIGEREGGWKGAIAGGTAGLLLPSLEGVIGRQIRNRAVPYVVNALSSGAPETLGSVLRYGESAAKGAAKLSAGINALFKAGGTQAVDAYASDRDKYRLDEYVSNGDINSQIQEQALAPPPAQNAPQHFAEGGEVKNPQNEPTPASPVQPVLKSVSGISKAMPEHAAILAGAKVRVANYLNSLRPQKNAPKLTFDDVPKNAEQHRSYQKALELAAQPLGVLNHMKAGTLTPEIMKHFTSMWPEVHEHISKKLTERIIQAQVDDEKPSYRVRQSMSLFLGAPIDGTLSQQSIQSIQAIYAPKPMPQATGVPQKKQTKNTSKLGEIPKDHFTQDQAAAQRTASWK